MELIPTQNYSLLYFYSNDINNLKSLSMKKVIVRNIIVKTQKQSWRLIGSKPITRLVNKIKEQEYTHVDHTQHDKLWYTQNLYSFLESVQINDCVYQLKLMIVYEFKLMIGAYEIKLIIGVYEYKLIWCMNKNKWLV